MPPLACWALRERQPCANSRWRPRTSCWIALAERPGIRSVMDLVGKIVNPRKVGAAVCTDIEVVGKETHKSALFAIVAPIQTRPEGRYRACGRVHVTNDKWKLSKQSTA